MEINHTHRTIPNTLYTIAHFERLLFSAIVHFLHPLILPTVSATRQAPQKGKKKKASEIQHFKKPYINRF